MLVNEARQYTHIATVGSKQTLYFNMVFYRLVAGCGVYPLCPLVSYILEHVVVVG